MGEISFWMPVTYGNHPKTFPQWALEKVDHAFYFSGRKAHVMPGYVQGPKAGVGINPEVLPFSKTVLKISSYVVLVGAGLMVSAPATLATVALLLLGAKVILRWTHPFYLLDAQQEVERGVALPNEVKDDLEGLVKRIQYGQQNPKIQWRQERGHLAFSLVSAPDWIFRIPSTLKNSHGGWYPTSESKVEELFLNFIRAQQVCFDHQLDLLLIPHAKMMSVNGVSLIAEKRISTPILPICRSTSTKRFLV